MVVLLCVFHCAPSCPRRMQVLCLYFGRYYCSVAAALLHCSCAQFVSSYAVKMNVLVIRAFAIGFFFSSFLFYLLFRRGFWFDQMGSNTASPEPRIRWNALQYFIVELMHDYLHDNLWMDGAKNEKKNHIAGCEIMDRIKYNNTQ